MHPGGKSSLTGLYSEVSPAVTPPPPPVLSVSQSLLAVLSLSPGGGTDTHVQFDDPCWRRHCCSLQPLGLAAQLASCDQDTTAALCHPTDHLTHVALLKSRPHCQPVCPTWGLTSWQGYWVTGICEVSFHSGLDRLQSHDSCVDRMTRLVGFCLFF